MREEVLYEVFLDLINSYDTVDRYCCMWRFSWSMDLALQIEGILHYFWDHISMMARAGRYCETPSKGHRGVTQGGPLYPTIFNMMFDTIIWHWGALVAG